VNQPAAEDVRVLDARPGAFWLGSWSSFNALVWLKSATVDVCTQVEKALEARFEAHHQLMSTVHVIVADAGPPQPDARDELEAINARLAHTVACGAVVIERGGLLGIALRSVITGLIIAAPKHYRVKVFDSIEPCAPWVADQHEKATSTTVDPNAVLELLKHARKTAR
jgi:hypothetical protein